MPSRFRALVGSLVFALVACTGEPAEPAAGGAGDGPAPEAGAAATDSVPTWVGEIRSGIAPLAGRVTRDPEGARQRAVELYVTRQERIEQSVGPGTGSDAALAATVHDAEARFHALMQLLGSAAAPDSASVAAAVAALDAELARVTDLAPAPTAP